MNESSGLSRLLCLLAIAVSVTVLCFPVRADVTFSGNTSANPTAPNANPIIGVDDIGRMTIDSGSSLVSTNAVIGDAISGIGIVVVDEFSALSDTPSTWTTTTLVVGDEGTGRLEVTEGAIVSVDVATNPGAGDIMIGAGTTGLGTVIVNGLGSLLRAGDDTTVGGSGSGILRIENEAFVVATNDRVSGTDVFTVGLLGRVEMSGNGRLRTQSFTNNGVVVGDGRIDSEGTIANSFTGHLAADALDHLTVNAAVTNQGEIAATGGRIEFLKPVTSTTITAEVTLRDGGSVWFPSTGFGYDSTSGTLATLAGVNDIYGTVRIQGTGSRILLGGESTAVFHDQVTNLGGALDIFPGSSVVFLAGFVTSGSGSVLSVHLADPDDEQDQGQVEINGAAQLAGNVEIRLAPGFMPSAGDTFTILSAGSVTGALNLSLAPPLAGGMIWDVDVGATSVLLSVVATGDFNTNGVVDAADYVVWRNSLGQMGDGLAADASGNRVVDIDDYLFWRARFGNVVASASAAAANLVPEPGGMALVMIVATCVVCCRPTTFECVRRARMLQ